MDPQELVPLESGIRRVRPSRQISVGSRSCHKGPIRLCRLLALMIALPCAFIFVPLYMRFRVFSGQMYPMSMTDMRLIDSKISPTWCQRQVVRSNTTFNAFVVPGPPVLTDKLVPVSMTRELELEDDMKEYWGFYLLQGSTVTVSACVRWPGASLIMIKGYKHLQECAYIGDDSSEELDELLEAHELGLLSNTSLLEKIQLLKKEDGKANDPGTMKRQKSGVSFHDPSQSANVTSSDNMPAADVTDHDPKELREILERLHALRQAAKNENFKHYHPPSHLMAVPALHRHRDTNVDRNERRWLSFRDLESNTTKLINDKKNYDQENITNIDTDTKTQNMKTNYNKFPLKIQNQKQPVKSTIAIKHTKVNNITDTKNFKLMENYRNEMLNNTSLNNINNESEIKNTKDNNRKKLHPSRINNPENTTENELVNNPEKANSKEVFEEVLKQLKSLGDRGKRVLVRLHKSLGMEYAEQPSSDVADVITGSNEELDRLRQILVEAIDEEKTKTQRKQKRRDALNDARTKRELLLGQLELQKELNEDDEARDYAAEEGLEPDGYAEHHVHLNETTGVDMSNSEFWSSFSSSEEALLECAGLILNLPLTPHPSCKPDATAKDTDAASMPNALTYRVPANGYYFFVFNSENEVQRNYIRARFDLQKTRYDVARTALRECTNSTEKCALALDMFSTQKVVLEVPLRNNDSLWNEQFLVTSECEPRTSVYLLCALAVPLLILMFAFQ